MSDEAPNPSEQTPATAAAPVEKPDVKPSKSRIPPRDPDAREGKFFAVGSDAVRSIGSISARLSRVIESIFSGEPATAFAATLVPERVRGEPITGSPQLATLQFAPEALGLLGEDLESHALLEGGRLQVWLDGVNADVLSLVAVTGGGEPIRAEVDHNASVVHAEFGWSDPELPSEVGIVLRHTSDDA
jgi:hypothetical protein